MAPIYALMTFLAISCPMMAFANPSLRIPLTLEGGGVGAKFKTMCILNGSEQKPCVLDTGAAITAFREFPKTAYKKLQKIEDFGFSGVVEVCDLIEVPLFQVGDVKHENHRLVICPNLPFDLLGLNTIDLSPFKIVLNLLSRENSFIGYADVLLGDVNGLEFNWLSETNPLRKLILLSHFSVDRVQIENAFLDSGADSIVDLKVVNDNPEQFKKLMAIGGADMAGQTLEQYMVLAPKVFVGGMALTENQSMLTSLSLFHVGSSDAKVDLLVGQDLMVGRIWALDFANKKYSVTQEAVQCPDRAPPLCNGKGGTKLIWDGYGCDMVVCL